MQKRLKTKDIALSEIFLKVAEKFQFFFRFIVPLLTSMSAKQLAIFGHVTSGLQSYCFFCGVNNVTLLLILRVEIMKALKLTHMYKMHKCYKCIYIICTVTEQI